MGITDVLSSVGIIIGFTALLFAIRAYIKVEAMEKSTHSVQYVPMGQEVGNYDENGFEIMTEETKKKFTEDDLN